MDFLALAKLPLTTLILVGFFWMLMQLYKWGVAQFEAERTKNDFVDTFEMHVTFNHGYYLRALEDVIDEYQGFVDAEDTKPPMPAPKFEPLPWRRQAPKIDTDHIPTDRGFTEGYLDMADVAAHLSHFAPDRAGLALSYVELAPLVLQCVERCNAANDAPVDLAEVEAAHLVLMNTLAEILLVSHAFQDKQTRAKIKSILADETIMRNRSETKRAFNTLFKHLFGISYTDAQGDEQGPLGVRSVIGAKPKGGKFRFAAQSFNTINLKPRQAYIGNHLLWPAFILGLVALLLTTSGPLRELFFANAPTVNCETTVALEGDAPSVKCSYPARSLQEAVTTLRTLQTR